MIPYLPPAVVGLLLALCVFCGVVMMFGMHIKMRSELEPLSRRTRWFLVGVLLFLSAAGYAMYRLFERALDT